MYFKIETISALPTDFSYKKLRLRDDRKSGVPVRQPPARCATPFTGLSWHGSLTWLSPCCSIWSGRRWPFLVLSRSVERFLSLSFSPPGDRWCDVLGFVPAGNVSSSSAFQIFRDASHTWCLLCSPVSLPSFPFRSGMSSTVHLLESSKADVEHGHIPHYSG